MTLGLSVSPHQVGGYLGVQGFDPSADHGQERLTRGVGKPVPMPCEVEPRFNNINGSMAVVETTTGHHLQLLPQKINNWTSEKCLLNKYASCDLVPTSPKTPVSINGLIDSGEMEECFDGTLPQSQEQNTANDDNSQDDGPALKRLKISSPDLLSSNPSSDPPRETTFDDQNVFLRTDVDLPLLKSTSAIPALTLTALATSPAIPKDSEEDEEEEEEEGHLCEPIKRRVPMLWSPRLRTKDEKRRILKISLNKLRRIEDPELFLRRSVLVNNTMKRLQREIREEKFAKYHHGVSQHHHNLDLQSSNYYSHHRQYRHSPSTRLSDGDSDLVSSFDVLDATGENHNHHQNQLGQNQQHCSNENQELRTSVGDLSSTVDFYCASKQWPFDHHQPPEDGFPSGKRTPLVACRQSTITEDPTDSSASAFDSYVNGGTSTSSATMDVDEDGQQDSSGSSSDEGGACDHLFRLSDDVFSLDIPNRSPTPSAMFSLGLHSSVGGCGEHQKDSSIHSRPQHHHHDCIEDTSLRLTDANADLGERLNCDVLSSLNVVSNSRLNDSEASVGAYHDKGNCPVSDVHSLSSEADYLRYSPRSSSTSSTTQSTLGRGHCYNNLGATSSTHLQTSGPGAQCSAQFRAHHNQGQTLYQSHLDAFGCSSTTETSSIGNGPSDTYTQGLPILDSMLYHSLLASFES